MRRRTIRSAAWLAAAVAASVTLAACSGGGAENVPQAGKDFVVAGELIASAALFDAARKEGSVTVYTSLNEVTNTAVVEAFEKDTGLSVEGVVTPTGRLFERIQSEAGANALPADVIAMPDQSLFGTLVDRNMFTKHTVPADGFIPDGFKSPDGLYYALNSAATVIAWNKEVIKDADVPKTWAELPAAAAAGKRVGMVHASQGAGGWGLALFMRQKLGPEYWQQLAATKPVLESSVGALAEKLGRGEVAIAAARPPEVGALQKQGAPVDFLWPQDGTPMFSFYIGQVAKGKHPSAAQVYINWSMSKRGQSVLAAQGGDFPVHREADGPVINGKKLPALNEVKPYVADPKDWVTLRNVWIAEWNKVFGYRP